MNIPFIYGLEAVILSGQTDSAAIALTYESESGQPGPVYALTLLGVGTPAAVTGTTFKILAANSLDGTYRPLYDAENAGDYSFSMAADKQVVIDPAIAAGARFIKIQSGSAEAADRTFDLLVRRVM